MARKKVEDDDGGYSWMDTYGDMVTLLLTFFIMLFSMSSVDKTKFEILIQAFSRNPPEQVSQIALEQGSEGDEMVDAGGEYEMKVKDEIDIAKDRPIDISELYDYLKAYVDENNMSGSVTLEKDAMNNVYLRFDNNIFFDGDSAILRTESYPILTFMGECLKGVEDQILIVRVAGHTASVPMDNYPVNDWDLSANRANRVVNFFESKSDLDPTKLMANGYGKNQPRFPNDTAEGRAKNRRVEIMILGNQISEASADQLYTILEKTFGADLMTSNSDAQEILEAEMGKKLGDTGTVATTSGSDTQSGQTTSGSSSAQSSPTQSESAQSNSAQSSSTQSEPPPAPTQSAPAAGSAQSEQGQSAAAASGTSDANSGATSGATQSQPTTSPAGTASP